MSFWPPVTEETQAFVGDFDMSYHNALGPEAFSVTAENADNIHYSPHEQYHLSSLESGSSINYNEQDFLALIEPTVDTNFGLLFDIGNELSSSCAMTTNPGYVDLTLSH